MGSPAPGWIALPPAKPPALPAHTRAFCLPRAPPKNPVLVHRQKEMAADTRWSHSQAALELSTCSFPPPRDPSQSQGAATSSTSCKIPQLTARAAGTSSHCRRCPHALIISEMGGPAPTVLPSTPNPTDTERSHFTLAQSLGWSWLPSSDLDLAIDFCALAHGS